MILQIKSRELRVDHVLSYKVPKEDEQLDELTRKIHEEGVAPVGMEEDAEKSASDNTPSPTQRSQKPTERINEREIIPPSATEHVTNPTSNSSTSQIVISRDDRHDAGNEFAT